jgi:hypothetical protein
MADHIERKRSSRVLRFAVSGALLTAAPVATLVGCGTPPHVNEPADEHVNVEPDELEQPTVNEQAPEDSTGVDEPVPEK